MLAPVQNELGDGDREAATTPTGDPEVLEPSTDKTNFQSVTVGTIEKQSDVSLPGLADSELTCFGGTRQEMAQRTRTR